MPNKDNKIPIDLKNEENQFYKSDKFRIDLDEGKHLRGILVKIYPDRGSINTIYREQGNDLRALLDGSMTPDVLWLDVLDNLSLFNKLEAFIEYLYEKDINENMNTILLSIDPNLTRKKPESPIPPGENHDPEREKKEKCLKLCKKLLRWFFYIIMFTIFIGSGYLIVRLIFFKSVESTKYSNSSLDTIIDLVSKNYFQSSIIKHWDKNYEDESRLFNVKGEYVFYPGKAEIFFKQIESENQCLKITLKNNDIYVQFKENIVPVNNDDPLARNTYKCPS